MATMKVARSSLECRLFIELDVCACGQPPGELAHRLVSRDERLIDAGQFLRESDRAVRRVLDSPAPQNLYWLGRAIACLEEVLKWIPDGEERPPAGAFFTEDGLRFAREEPGRFRRPRLLAVLAAYQEQHALARAQLG